MSNEQKQKVHEILEELKTDIQHHRQMYKKHKKCFNKLHFIGFTSNLISMGCYSTSISTVTNIIPLSIAASIIGITSTGVNIFCNELNKHKAKKIKKHIKILNIGRNIEAEMIRTCLNDDNITQEDFDKIIILIKDYYQQTEDISIITLKTNHTKK